jgi:glyceraldehyde 3-phosphate dehydrogenase
MSIRIGINGFGRIGRLVARALSEYDIKDVELVAINSPGAAATSAHLLRYDSVHGRFGAVVTEGDGWIEYGRGKVRMTHERDPAKIGWGDLDVDIVMECTGIFRSKESVQPHLAAGAKAVLISAPGQEVDKTIVYGVNHNDLTKDDIVVSCASCTTNCLAPIAKVIMNAVGIRRGFMTTVHSYTQDQRILDNSHKDLYRARAAGLNMIPTSTGAAKAVSLVLPELEGKLSGSAVRVPTANVSMIDLAFQPEMKTTAEDLNAAMKFAAQGEMKGVICYSENALVSSDLNHDPNSATFAAPLTKVLDGHLVKIIAWYDNEWGFANRMIDVSREMGRHIKDKT